MVLNQLNLSWFFLFKMLKIINIINTRILLSSITLLAAGALVIGATFAFFSDTETSQDNTLTAGAIDLKIDNTSYYNGVLNENTSWQLNDLTDQLFFDFSDVKPGDLGEDTISLHAQNDYWLCANLTLTANDDNTCTEPELLDDATCTEPDTDLLDGELAQNINFIFWADDGDNVLETGEEVIEEGSASAVLNKNIALADSQTNGGDPIIGGDNETYYIGKAWCFGTLTKDPVPAGEGVNPTVDGGVTCDGSLLDNATQTDKVLADIQFDAVQARNNPDFTCEPPVVVSCNTEDAIFASSFSNNDQGRRKNGTAVLANRSIPSAAFGAPQTSGADSDAGFPLGSFFSLGFPNVSPSTASASIVFGFAEPFYPNPVGPDLQVFEVTGGAYPDEKVKIEASANPSGPWTLLAASATRDEAVELGILPFAQYVRLTDVSNIALFEPEADGYDVDAVKAFCTEANNNED